MDETVAEPIQVHRNYAPDLPLIWADPLKLQRAFSNLLHNAVKYSPGQKPVQVYVDAVTVEGAVVVSIRDLGMGIAPENVPKIFSLFYREPRTHDRHIGGSGLGMSIVKKIIDGHGGEILVESAVNQGTTVRVVLPVHGEGL
ncbi:hypothetical protein GTO89_08015 [Heliobacterium gestii]|uniref:histidine kinase n=1 Tax=Heliomicrobium gestii TaxID=2699 RepID=A0A845L9T5_HELGE|nr:ATP-binding protein [Heliomicrobium gestii]MBM7866226.1 signal transduction histidine kinase [Heliomicrobium gestii]MZP42978.1 hypothetical protein [Heliomicrobium gestii]